MTDLNTAIAVSKGWTRDGQNGWVLFKCVGIIDAKFNPPDYEHDANLYMALFEEMPNASLKHHNDLYYCGVYVDGNLECWSSADTIGTAICQAYCKLKGIG
jgi:hypothetical protein